MTTTRAHKNHETPASTGDSAPQTPVIEGNFGLNTVAHWYVSQAGDYYELPYRALAPGTYRLEVRVYLVENGSFRDLSVGSVDHADAAIIPR